MKCCFILFGFLKLLFTQHSKNSLYIILCYNLVVVVLAVAAAVIVVLNIKLEFSQAFLHTNTGCRLLSFLCQCSAAESDSPISGTDSEVAGIISATSSMKTVRESMTVIPEDETKISVITFRPANLSSIHIRGREGGLLLFNLTRAAGREKPTRSQANLNIHIYNYVKNRPKGKRSVPGLHGHMFTFSFFLVFFTCFTKQPCNSSGEFLPPCHWMQDADALAHTVTARCGLRRGKSPQTSSAGVDYMQQLPQAESPTEGMYACGGFQGVLVNS